MSYVIGATPGATHTVVTGDTLDKIAQANGTTWQELARINNMSPPDPPGSITGWNLIKPGQVIKLSESVAEQSGPPAPASSSSSSDSSDDDGMSLLTKIAVGAGALVAVGVVLKLTRG